MNLKTKEEVEIIRDNCLLVCKALTRVAEMLKPGMTGNELDREAEQLIRDHGSEPGFLNYDGFPATLCISKNDCVVHGIPDDVEYVEGDVISVDCGTKNNGFYGDAAYTFVVGEAPQRVMELLVATKESLRRGIEAAQLGNRLGDVGYAIQHHCEKENSYSVVRELVGHGIGRNLHERPNVPNYGRRSSGVRLKEGLVIAIEPMINLGKRGIYLDKDGWSVLTRDHSISAHYEHTIAITPDGPDILSSHEGVEKAIKNNPNIAEITVNY